MDIPPQNLYQAQPGPINSEPILPPTAPPQGYGQPLQPIAQPVAQPVITPYAQPVVQPIAQPVITPAYIPPGPPIMQPPVQNQPIVVNQVIPVVQIKLRSSPVAMICPFCKNNITTVTDTQFNCLNCCFCYWAFIIWIIVQLISDKDLNCTDAVHKCPKCGNIVGKYEAC